MREAKPSSIATRYGERYRSRGRRQETDQFNFLCAATRCASNGYAPGPDCTRDGRDGVMCCADVCLVMADAAFRHN